MTTASKITLVRVVLIPVFMVLLLCSGGNDALRWAALGVFVVASISDFVDGYIARHYNQVTDFGKFLDPLADKILVAAALLGLVEMQLLPSWIALIILAREFIVSGLRMLAANQGVVIAASWYGKVKTVSQIVAIIAFIIKDTVQFHALGDAFAAGFNAFAWIAMLFAVIMTILSMVDYFAKSKAIFGYED